MQSENRTIKGAVRNLNNSLQKSEPKISCKLKLTTLFKTLLLSLTLLSSKHQLNYDPVSKQEILTMIMVGPFAAYAISLHTVYMILQCQTSFVSYLRSELFQFFALIICDI